MLQMERTNPTLCRSWRVIVRLPVGIGRRKIFEDVRPDKEDLMVWLQWWEYFGPSIECFSFGEGVCMKTYVGQKWGIIIRKQKCSNSLENKFKIATRCVDIMVHFFYLIMEKALHSMAFWTHNALYQMYLICFRQHWIYMLWWVMHVGLWLLNVITIICVHL